MASSGKRKTTMAKLNREHRLRERRLEKQARKDARKRAPVRHLRPISEIPVRTGPTQYDEYGNVVFADDPAGA